MSKLEELIQELCPDGVEYRKVGEICNISVGGDAPKNSMSKQKTEKYSVPIISNGIGENALYGYTDVSKVNEPGVTVAARGTIGYAEYRDYPFYPIIRLLTAIPKDATAVNTKYLYYCLQGKQYSIPMGGIPQLTAPKLEKVSIPVPPLEVQREIVHILDSFTLLTAELTAELTARKKQYEYYRDTLLTFNDNNPLRSLISHYCPSGVEYKKIGDIAFISTGSKLRDIQESHSLYEYINAGTTNSGYSLDWNCDGDVVTTPSRGQGGIGYVGYQKNKFWLGPLCYKIVGNADFVLNKYLYYYLSNNSYEILSLKKDGGVPAINKSDLEELILPVPPLEVQRQIVQILDRFDTICSDLNIGLPAEIEARQKQYEFYRDKLLSFKQL